LALIRDAGHSTIYGDNLINPQFTDDDVVYISEHFRPSVVVSCLVENQVCRTCIPMITVPTQHTSTCTLTIRYYLKIFSSELATHRVVLPEGPFFVFHMLGTCRRMMTDLLVNIYHNIHAINHSSFAQTPIPREQAF